MIRFSKKTEYAIIAMSHMAEKPAGELTSCREMAEQYNISDEVLSKVLQGLARNRVVVSVQGTKGGYQIQRPLEQISIREIVSAIDEPLQLVDCFGKEEECTCEQLPNCNIKNPMHQIQLLLESFFDSVSLKDFKEKSWMLQMQNTFHQS